MSRLAWVSFALSGLILLFSFSSQANNSEVGGGRATSNRPADSGRPSHPSCARGTLEAQFIADVVKTEPSQRKDKDKGWLCRLKISFDFFRPAQQECWSDFKSRVTENFIEVWSGKNRECPDVEKKKFLRFSGVVQLREDGKIDWDADWHN